MSVVENIVEKTKTLPPERQAEVLEFVEFLKAREQAQAESHEWAVHSAAHLTKAYGPSDAIYDED